MINQKVLASVLAIACLLSTVSTAVINPDPNCLLFDSNGKCLSKPSQQVTFIKYIRPQPLTQLHSHLRFQHSRQQRFRKAREIQQLP